MSSSDANEAAGASNSSTRKPTDDENEQLDYLINAPMRSAKRLMEALYEDDSFYESTTYAWVSEDDAKKLFLYGVCKEVFKACVALLNDKETFQEVPEGDPDQMMKIITGSITDGQAYRVRKLVELLVWLVLFDRKAATDIEYRIFLSAENLDLALGQQLDFSDLHDGRTISNTQHSVDDFAERVRRDLERLGAENTWFLNAAKLREKRRPSVFRSKKALFFEALTHATPDERLALGTSYGRGYSRISQAVHPLLGSHDYNKKSTSSEIKQGFSYLSIVAMHVMHLAFKLARIEDPAGIATVMGSDFQDSEAASIIGRLKKEYVIGDVVLTSWTDLAEVIEEHTSKYGYKAYRVRFLSQPPIPEYPDDWLEAQYILARLLTKANVRQLFEKAIRSNTLPKETAAIAPELLKLSDDDLHEHAKNFYLDLHKAGILIPMLLKSGFLKRLESAD